jgi:hypothetical protein
MRRHRKPRHGEGTAWLVVDRVEGDYLCYWYTGTGDGYLVAHARTASAEDAVAWGRQRTPRVRIRTPDSRTYWAGTTPTPQGFAHTWTQPNAVNTVRPPRAVAAPSSPGPTDELTPGPTNPSAPRRAADSAPRPAPAGRRRPGNVTGGAPC